MENICGNCKHWLKRGTWDSEKEEKRIVINVG